SGIHVFNGTDKMNDAFLPRDSSHEKDERLGGINSMASQRRGGIDLSIFLEIDPVIDDAKSFRKNREEPFQVSLRFAGDGDNSVRHFQRSLFHPDGKIVAAAELLAFPRSQRFERMDRDHERNSVIHFGEDPAEMAVPGVAMHEIGVDVCEIESVASRHRTENRLERLWTSELARVDFEAADLEISFLELLIAETAHLDRHCLRELSREIIDMHSRTTIDVRRIFVRKEERLHAA